MKVLMSQLLPYLIASSLGAYLATTMHLTSSLFGAAPLVMLSTGGILAAAFALLWSLPIQAQGNRRAVLGLLMPLLMVGISDWALWLLGHLPLLPEVTALLFGGLWIAASVPFLRLATATAQPASPHWMLLAATLGLPAGLLPPWAGMVVVALLAGPAIAQAPRTTRDTFSLQGASNILPIGLSVIAIGVLWLSFRAALDPTMSSFMLILSGAFLGAGLGRRLTVAVLWPRLLLAGTSILVIWLGWGALWVQSEALLFDGLTTLWMAELGAGLASGVLVGWCWGQRSAPLGCWGLVVGLALLLGLSWGSATGPLLVLAAGSGALLLGVHPGTRVTGLLLVAGAAIALFLDRGPVPTLAAEGRYTQHRTQDAAQRSEEARDGLRATVSEWGSHGLLTVRAPESLWQSQGPTTAARIQVEQDGLVAELPSRANKADALAGHLAGALGPRNGRVLVLGDDLGTSLIELLRYTPSQVRVATPFREAVQSVAKLDPQRKQAWLDPAVELVPVSPSALLHLTPSADIIVEISRAPWADSSRALLNPAHLRAVSRRLSADGVYVLALHLLWHDINQPEAIVSAIADRFSHVQLWLPPAGADTLLVVAAQHPLSLEQLLSRLQEAGPSRLQAIGLRNELALASLAMADRAGALSWAGGARPGLLDGLRLPSVIWSRPLLHLASLSDHVSPVGDIWDMIPAEAGPALVERRQARETLLVLLGRAASGDMRGVFEEALSMREVEDGVEALNPLIEPHLRDAQISLGAARDEGPDSLHWETALRFATTARMLSPESPRPYLALGDIAMGRRDLVQAAENYLMVLERAPGDLQAMTSLARIAHIRGDGIEEERLLREAVVQNAREWRAHQNLGTMLLYAGRYDEAKAAIQDAAALSEGGSEPPLLAMAEIYLATSQPTRALVEAERATQIGGSGQSWFLRGRAHYDLEQLSQAAEDYQRAVLKQPTHALAHAALGHVRAQQGMWAQSAEALRHSLQINPDNEAARELLNLAQRKLREAQP